MPYIDLYQIGYSEQFDILGREEKTESLNLNPNADANSGSVAGTVTSNGVPVQGAVVKLYDVNDNPIEHTNTNPQGQYNISNIPVGSYKIVAAKDGYLSPTSIPVSIQKNKVTTANIVIQADPDANLSSVFGIIRSNIGETPLQDAIVTLFETSQGEPALVGTSVSNDKGQYLFTKLTQGEYYAVASKQGYLPNQTAALDIGIKDYVDADITLVTDPQSNTGTVSGFIYDHSTNLPIPNATVALYLISQGTESIIALTKTSASGRYLFGSITPGSYRVKATVQAEG